ncbi:MAG TPA: PH domain-containing protein [Actinophytocola sp.]|uniref:PH domain-containing protein n=1 Tax=Actinophytocola sp. TaxID=1872138 RepID=UPI002DDD0D06|nr:PH domain-containing protein [Actinophytocola sp.]HEV2777973.1 PH domain-containing protein [Actinophytocola sp.]
MSRGVTTADLGGEWRELDRRSPAVTALLVAGIALGAAVPMFVSTRDDGVPATLLLPLGAVGILALAGLAAIGDRVRWRHTRYRVTDERVELRFSWVVHRLRSVPRDRIRTVDLTANPLLRLFGVVKVQIGTGQQSGDKTHLVLSPLERRVAERLRAELLDRTETPETPAAAAPEPPAAGPEVIAALDWSWIRYAPVSVTTPIIGSAAFGGLLQVSEWFGLQETVMGRIGDFLGERPLAITIAILVAVGVIIGVLGSLALFVELWRGYRLTRESGLLRVHRGLLTTRSLSLDERRLRGVEVAEPLGARLIGGARVDAVATGLRVRGGDERSDPRTLLPAAPRALAHDVAAEIVREPVSPTRSARLCPHPRAARGRRLRWAIGAVLLISGGLALLGTLLSDVLLDLAVLTAVAGLPVAVALALDAYRNLGHGITGEYLVTRHGTVSRHTIALQRAGVIGWTITSSPFQRRAGLLTLNATTAANRGSYPVYDVGEGDGLAFADEAVPGLLTPFLERADVTSA